MFGNKAKKRAKTQDVAMKMIISDSAMRDMEKISAVVSKATTPMMERMKADNARAKAERAEKKAAKRRAKNGDK